VADNPSLNVRRSNIEDDIDKNDIDYSSVESIKDTPSKINPEAIAT